MNTDLDPEQAAKQYQGMDYTSLLCRVVPDTDSAGNTAAGYPVLDFVDKKLLLLLTMSTIFCILLPDIRYNPTYMLPRSVFFVTMRIPIRPNNADPTGSGSRTGVYIHTNSQNLVRGKKSALKKEGEKISQGNDDKKGIKERRG